VRALETALAKRSPATSAADQKLADPPATSRSGCHQGTRLLWPCIGFDSGDNVSQQYQNSWHLHRRHNSRCRGRCERPGIPRPGKGSSTRLLTRLACTGRVLVADADRSSDRAGRRRRVELHHVPRRAALHRSAVDHHRRAITAAGEEVRRHASSACPPRRSSAAP
jgi:hypothetical protein